MKSQAHSKNKLKFGNSTLTRRQNVLQIKSKQLNKLVILLIINALVIKEIQTYAVCSGDGLLSPINVSQPWDYERKFLFFYVMCLTQF